MPRSARPLEILRDWLAHVDADARRQIERLFEPLTAAVHRAIVSVDSPDELDRALALVEREFIALTRPSATGQSGQDQARRRLVCARLERDVRAAIGADILAPLSQSLPLLLQTALWFLQELQREYEKAATQLYRTLPTDRGKPWSMLELRGAMCDRGVLSCAPPPWHVAAQRHLEERWATLWMRRGLLSAGQCLRMDAADLEPEIDEMFPIDPGGLLHHASSDVLIARASGTASPTIVIDEIHLIDASDESTVALAPDASLPARGRSVRPVDALVELRDGRLWVRDRTRTFEMPLGELSADLVTLGIRHELSPWPCMSYRPRVVLNNVVIARETWTCRAEELTFAALTTERERYLGARRWARSRRLPRFAFVKVPTESLPLLVDFASTPLVELFMSALRGALARAATADVVVSEMLPCFKELWLEDAAGARYVSRLRVVAVPSVRRRGSRGPVDQEARAVAMDTLAHAR